MIALQAEQAAVPPTGGQLQTVLEEQGCTGAEQGQLHAAPEGQEAQQLAGRPGDEAAAAAKGQLAQAGALAAAVALFCPGLMQKCTLVSRADRHLCEVLPAWNCACYRQALCLVQEPVALVRQPVSPHTPPQPAACPQEMSAKLAASQAASKLLQTQLQVIHATDRA